MSQTKHIHNPVIFCWFVYSILFKTNLTITKEGIMYRNNKKTIKKS